MEKMNETNKAVHLPHHLIPTTSELVRMYEERGGKLSTDPSVGYDPIVQFQDLQDSREHMFYSKNPSFEKIFSDVVHGDVHTFVAAIQSFIEITLMLSASR